MKRLAGDLTGSLRLSWGAEPGLPHPAPRHQAIHLTSNGVMQNEDPF